MSTQDELLRMGGGLLTDIAIGAITDFLKRRREAGDASAVDLTAAEREDVDEWVKTEQAKMVARLDSAPNATFAEDRAEGRERARKS